MKCDYYLPRQRIWCLIAYLSPFQGENGTHSLESCPLLGAKKHCLHVLKYHPQTWQHLALVLIMCQDQTANDHYLTTRKTRKHVSIYTHLNISPWTPILQKSDLDLLITLTTANWSMKPKACNSVGNITSLKWWPWEEWPSTPLYLFWLGGWCKSLRAMLWRRWFFLEGTMRGRDPQMWFSN